MEANSEQSAASCQHGGILDEYGFTCCCGFSLVAILVLFSGN
jgi:hypothetical protein